MNKKSKYGITGLLICGLGNAFLNAVNQSKSGEPFSLERFFIAMGKGAFFGGAVGFGISAIADYQNAQEKPRNTDAFLFGLTSRIALKKTDQEYLVLHQKAQWLAAILKTEFKYELANEPFLLGSTEKGTALRSKFDIDVCLAFKPNSFRSTEEMFDSVFSFLRKNEGAFSVAQIREQKKSVGVLFNIGGNEYKVDIVPYKLSSTKKNATSGYLYVNNKSFLWNDSSYTKTDIRTLNNLRLSPMQRKIVIALKHWKEVNNLPLSSYLLENLATCAYRDNMYIVPKNFTKKIIMVLRYIADNLETIEITSPENTNNVLTNIPDQDKAIIVDACKRTVEEFEYQPNSILDTFAFK